MGPRRFERARAGLAIGLVGSLVGMREASAQPSAEAQTRAEVLYEDGVRLMSSGRDAEACPLLARSQALDPALGTLLALARCQEKLGKLASAWGAYLDVAARAARAGQGEREAAARAQAAALEARLPRLTIEIGPAVAGLPGLRIERDGVEVGSAIAGTAVPVDPGEHVVEVHADGRAAAVQRATVGEGETRRLTFASLDPGPTSAGDTPRAPRPAPAGEARDGGLTALQVGGLVTGGLGAVAIGVGGVLGILAAGANADSEDTCAPFADGRGGTAAAYDACTGERRDAGALADASTGVFVTGGALLGVGLGLVLLGGDDGGDGARVTVGPRLGGLQARGSF